MQRAGEQIFHSPTWISILRTPHGMQRQTCTTIVDIPTCWLHILLILQPHSKAAKLVLLHRNHLLVQSFSAKLSVFLCSLRVRTSSYVYIIPLRNFRFNLTSRIIISLPKSDASYIPRTFCFYLWNSRSFSKTNILPDNHRLLALGHRIRAKEAHCVSGGSTSNCRTVPSLPVYPSHLWFFSNTALLGAIYILLFCVDSCLRT